MAPRSTRVVTLQLPLADSARAVPRPQATAGNHTPVADESGQDGSQVDRHILGEVSAVGRAVSMCVAMRYIRSRCRCTNTR